MQETIKKVIYKWI